MPRYTRFMHDNSQTAALWDDAARTFTTYDETGAVTSTRPYTSDENAAAVAVDAHVRGARRRGRPGA